jgi:hypothetical protein
MGKGSRPRPYSVTSQEFDQAWDRIFGNKDDEARQTDKVHRRES